MKNTQYYLTYIVYSLNLKSTWRRRSISLETYYRKLPLLLHLKKSVDLIFFIKKNNPLRCEYSM